MVAAAMLLFVGLQVAQPPAGPVGTIEGVVLNGTSDQAVGAGTEIVLRVQIDGQFVAVTETTTDPNGAFRFHDVPAVAEAVYLPGANCGGVHYPGPRVQLTPALPHARVPLTVYEPCRQVSPLVIRRHEVKVEPVPGALRVTESLRIENPSRTCYVGDGSQADAAGETLRLEIPPDFERTTFDSEFLGRRFSWQDNALVTRIPWPPGTRDIGFTYIISQESGGKVWERRVDLPSDEIRLTVHCEQPEEVSCPVLGREELQVRQVTFVSQQPIAAGEVIRLELSQLPVSLTSWMRWIAVGMLAGAVLITAGGLWGTRIIFPRRCGAR